MKTNHISQKTALRINAAAWTVIAIAIMAACYFAWSKNGVYTLASFFASLVFHGGGCAVIGMSVGDAIKRHYYNKNQFFRAKKL